jgi:hypothetical protein
MAVNGLEHNHDVGTQQVDVLGLHDQAEGAAEAAAAGTMAAAAAEAGEEARHSEITFEDLQAVFHFPLKEVSLSSRLLDNIHIAV